MTRDSSKPLTSHRSYILWFLALAIGACGGLCALAPMTTAGSVDIVSCDSAPGGGADDAWAYLSTNASTFAQTIATCPSTGITVGSDIEHPQILGLSAWTLLNSGAAATIGQGAQYRFTAPLGTTVTRVQIKRDIGLYNDSYLVFGRTDAAQLAGETCSRVDPAFTCSVGGYSAPAADFLGLSTSWVAWGFECGAHGLTSCDTGTTLHSAWAHIYASTVTLTDNQAPTGVSAAGALTAGGWKGGVVAVDVSGSDNLGIRTVRWYADGVLVGGSGNSVTRACDFSTPVPCTDVSAGAASLDTTALADGARSVQLALVDPAGNETKGSAFGVQVDNTAPAAPTGLVVSGGGSSPAFGLGWTDPSAGSGAPLASIRWQACDGGTCSSGSTAPTGGAQSLGGLTLPAAGSYVVRVWAVDQAGNGTSAGAAAVGSVTYTAPSGGGGSGGGGNGNGGGGGSGVGGGGSDNAPLGAGTPTPSLTGFPPGPVGPAAPTLPATPTSAPAPTTAWLRITTARLSARTGRLVVRGSLPSAATGRVTISYRAKARGRWRTERVTTRLTRGRFSATMTLSRVLRAGANPRVTVAYPGSRAFAAARRTVVVRAAGGGAAPEGVA
jgi:hypothetical protein